MAYVPLILPNSLPASVRMVIEIGVEPPLSDVHWMLATPVGISTDPVLPRQLALPIALMLLTTVAGVSKWLFHTDKDDSGDNDSSGYKFKECLIRYFPWQIVRPACVPPEGAANILYEHFRNPLVHELGFHKRGSPNFKIIQPFPGTDDYEKRIEELERLTEEQITGNCPLVTREERVLYLPEFYWGVRKLVERWSCDNTQVSLADARLSRRVDEGGGDRLSAKKDTDDA